MTLMKKSKHSNIPLPQAEPRPSKQKTGKQPKAKTGKLAICVFCGSGKGLNPRFAAAAREFGRLMAESGLALVYGGGSNGLMGEVARSVLQHGGHVTGVIPESLLDLEKPLTDIQDLKIVSNLHERKMLMFEASQAFVALPGGLGTLEELVEQMTWVQIGHHTKPIVIVNLEGYWNPLLKMFDDMRAQTFIRNGLEARFHLVEEVSQIIPALRDILPVTQFATLPQAAQ